MNPLKESLNDILFMTRTGFLTTSEMDMNISLPFVTIFMQSSTHSID